MIIKDIFFKIPGQFKDKPHLFRVPGVFQDQGYFPGLFKVCANPEVDLIPIPHNTVYYRYFGNSCFTSLSALNTFPFHSRQRPGHFDRIIMVFTL